MSERIKHAERLEKEAAKNQEWAESYRNTASHATDKFSALAEALRAGAAAIRELEAMENIPHEVECATFVASDEPRRESTITLPLAEWKQLRAQRDAIAAEAGRLREAVVKMPCWCKMPVHPDDKQCLRCQTILAIPTTDAWLTGKIAESVGPLEAQVAALREAVKNLMNELDSRVYAVMAIRAYEDGNQSLAQTAATASRYRARVRAEVLREAANLIRQTTPDGEMKSVYEDGKQAGRYYAIEQIEQLADAAEREQQG